MSVVFDKRSFVKRLEGAGTFSRPQAKTWSAAFRPAVSETVATRQDVAMFRSELGHEIARVRIDLGREIEKVRTGLTHEISQTRIDLQHEAGLVRREIKVGLAETRVWTVSVGATTTAALAAMKYFG